MLVDELLAHLRRVIGAEVGFAEEPVRLGGGFYTANHRFSLTGAPPEWSGPLVLRLFPTHAPDGLDSWEAAVQSFATERGIPAPAVKLHDPAMSIDGRRWLVMAMLPGAPAMGTSIGPMVRNLRAIVRDLPRQTAEAHLALHRLDPAPLVGAFGSTSGPDRWLDRVGKPDDDGRPHPLAPGIEWLQANRPEPRAALALCHGDTWGGNVLVDGGRVTGLIDWTVATVAEPALEVGFLTTALTMAPMPGARPIQRVARRVGRGLANAYRASYEAGSDADLTNVPYYEAMRCLLEMTGVVAYRTAKRGGQAYDSPRPAWDAIADDMVEWFAARSGVRIELPPPA